MSTSGGGANDDVDVDVSTTDIVQYARMMALYVGCRDDASLALVLNCYGDSLALVRRSALLDVYSYRPLSMNCCHSLFEMCRFAQ